MQKKVEITFAPGGRMVCACHGWSIRYIQRRNGDKDPIHCEHPKNYIIYGDGYIPDYCEKCGWNLGKSDERLR